MNKDMDMSVHVKVLCMYIILNIVMYVGECMCLYISSIRYVRVLLPRMLAMFLFL